MNLGFSRVEEDVGGMEVVVPIARDGVGGEVGRRLKILLCEELGSGKTYYKGGDFVSMFLTL